MKSKERSDIGKGLEAYRQNDGAILLDVRTRMEFRHGHIPGALNIPLSKISKASETIADKETPIYVYCLSGHRSEAASRRLKKQGYRSVMNIGAYFSYKGPKER